MRITDDFAPIHWFDPQGGRIVRESFRRSKQEAEGARLFDMQMRVEMLEDDWKDYLYAYLWQIYRSPAVRKRLGRMISTEHNVAKRIVRELSRVYKNGPTRELDSPKQDAIARQLWDEARIDERLALANFYVNGVRDVGLVPRVVDGKMWIDIWLPDRTQVIQHDENPTLAVAAVTERSLPNTQGYTTVKRIYVDAEKWKYYETSNALGQGAPKVEPHPYGRMPVVWVHADERIDTFWGNTIGSDLFDTNLAIGCDLFKLNNLTTLQSELQPTYQGNPRDLAKGFSIGGNAIWAGKGTFNVLQTQGDPSHLIRVIQARIGWIAQQYGLAADVYDLSSTATSGFQIRLKRQPLEEARISQVKTWRRIERELLTLMAQVSQAEHPTLKLDPMVGFKMLDFHEEPMLEDPSTENAVDENNVNNFRASEIDVIRRRNPDLTKEQARARFEEIVKERTWALGLKKSANSEMLASTTGDEPTPEENGRAGAKARGGIGKRAADALRELREAAR